MRFFRWIARQVRALYRFFTYDITTLKSLLIMGLLAVILWAVPIWYTGKNPQRYLLGDFERWEIWWAITAPLLAIAIGLFARHRSKVKQKERAQAQQLRQR